MNSLLPRDSDAKASTARLARLGASHGYRFEGDRVHINAMFTVLDPAAHQLNWSLQLWACPAAPAGPAKIRGELVAEAALPPIGEVADEIESFDVSAPVCLPTGQADHCIVLALVAGNAGKAVVAQDFAVYPRREYFPHPRMMGGVGFHIEGGRVKIEVERIENPREASNLSGTLALELWALCEPYQGGRFNGISLAGVAFDALSGQCEYRQRSHDLPFTTPPAGTWNLVLMLREWTAAGFGTRDFTNFNVPMTVAAPDVSARPPKISSARIPVTKAAVATVVPAKGVIVPAKEVKAPAAPATSMDAGPVSVNTATAEQLAAVKGLPTKVAEGIVSRRPFKSLDELLKVKGMGEKLLAKLRSRLKL
jgi:competence ComEA-like helix-hairpin-helix protein